ncbi:hypothetical protein HK104_006997 [Borealophlyctis nickersoniae]|nr:hypothetical protein HK104_006997 [Borealophlyctis nickersoniae]
MSTTALRARRAKGSVRRSPDPPPDRRWVPARLGNKRTRDVVTLEEGEEEEEEGHTSSDGSDWEATRNMSSTRTTRTTRSRHSTASLPALPTSTMKSSTIPFRSSKRKKTYEDDHDSHRKDAASPARLPSPAPVERARRQKRGREDDLEPPPKRLYVPMRKSGTAVLMLGVSERAGRNPSSVVKIEEISDSGDCAGGTTGKDGTPENADAGGSHFAALSVSRNAGGPDGRDVGLDPVVEASVNGDGNNAAAELNGSQEDAAEIEEVLDKANRCKAAVKTIRQDAEALCKKITSMKIQEIELEQHLIENGTHPDLLAELAEIEERKEAKLSQSADRLRHCLKSYDAVFDASVRLANDTFINKRGELRVKMMNSLTQKRLRLIAERRRRLEQEIFSPLPPMSLAKREHASDETIAAMKRKKLRPGNFAYWLLSEAKRMKKAGKRVVSVTPRESVIFRLSNIEKDQDLDLIRLLSGPNTVMHAPPRVDYRSSDETETDVSCHSSTES